MIASAFPCFFVFYSLLIFICFCWGFLFFVFFFLVVCSGYFFWWSKSLESASGIWNCDMHRWEWRNIFMRKLFPDTFWSKWICLSTRWNILIFVKKVLRRCSGGDGGRPEDRSVARRPLLPGGRWVVVGWEVGGWCWGVLPHGAAPLCPAPAVWWDAAEVGAVGRKRRWVQLVDPSQRTPVLPGKKHGTRDNNPWKELSHRKILFRIELPRWLAAPGVLPLKSLLLLMSLRYISSV